MILLYLISRGLWRAWENAAEAVYEMEHPGARAEQQQWRNEFFAEISRLYMEQVKSLRARSENT